MKILLLEDDGYRANTFSWKLSGMGSSIDFYQNYEDAIKGVFDYSDRYELMLLDHDLGDGKKTGYDFVKRLLTNMEPEKWPLYVIVHSMNFPGAKRMIDLFKDVGITNVVHIPYDVDKIKDMITKITGGI